jgi:hypothetical protein
MSGAQFTAAILRACDDCGDDAPNGTRDDLALAAAGCRALAHRWRQDGQRETN